MMLFFFFNDTAATEIYTLSLHDALPIFNGHPDGMLLEAPAGLLEAEAPAEAIRREVEEETGFRVGRVEPVFAAYMSPGSVTERLHFFTAEYRPADRVGEGGGSEQEGEDIEVVEVNLDEALAMVRRGEIVDGKTIMLLQHLALRRQDRDAGFR